MRLLVFFGLCASFLVSFVAAQTNAIDQAAMLAFWKGLTNKEILVWNTASFCGQTGVICTSEKVGRVTTLAMMSGSNWRTLRTPLTWCASSMGAFRGRRALEGGKCKRVCVVVVLLLFVLLCLCLSLVSFQYTDIT